MEVMCLSTRIKTISIDEINRKASKVKREISEGELEVKVFTGFDECKAYHSSHCLLNGHSLGPLY